MVNVILFGSFILLLVLNVPIAACLGLSAVITLLYAGVNPVITAIDLYAGIGKFLLLAIPFFVLAGNIMAKAGISDRLIEFADTCVGHKDGGIAIVSVIVACFFGALSGSGPATVAALGAILVPAMISKDGFPENFSATLLAAASSIAIVIPPSISFIVYGSITGAPVGDLFMAGIIPGILMGVALVVLIKITCKKEGIHSTRQKATGKERWTSFCHAFWAFLMPVIILGGIYGGIFTPTEAAAVSAVYGLIVGLFIYREIHLKDLFNIFVDSVTTSGSVMLIIGCAGLFSYVCTTEGISAAAQGVLGATGNKIVFLLIVNIIFLIAGCFIDANSAMYIFIPIMFPVAQALGVDLVQFGIIATVNLAIGQFTPPVGVNLFVASGLRLPGGGNVSVTDMVKPALKCVGVCLIVLLLITYIPALSIGILGRF
jgi:tripartite ATP-independent transporter DctM subunit